jgi:hypothetical protein
MRDYKPRYYILNGHTPVPVADMLEWAKWFETAGDARIVAQTEISENVRVSTVFLGMDHSFGFGADRAPMIFETMTFGGPCDQNQTRCSTWTEALLMHAAAIAMAVLDAPFKTVQ